jgi:hypothetical protein
MRRSGSPIRVAGFRTVFECRLAMIFGWCAAMSKLSSAVCVAFVFMAPVAAPAHHAAAMFETERTVTVSGTVKEFEYVNPHAWLFVVVTDDNGEETLWGFEAEGPSALMRAGIRNNALQPGDLVTVTARPRRDGRPAGAWVSVIKADGTVLAPRPVSLPPNPIGPGTTATGKE